MYDVPGDDIVTAPSHTRHVFEVENFPLLVEWVVGLARENGYEALAACGHSGLLVAAAAGYVLRVPVIAVRKAKDYAKGDGSSVNAVLPHRPLRYAVVDDFVSSGETAHRIVSQVALRYPALQLAAVLLHEQNSAACAGHLLEWECWEDVFMGAVVHARLGAFDHPELDTLYAVERTQPAKPLQENAQPVNWGAEKVRAAGEAEDLRNTIFDIAPFYADATPMEFPLDAEGITWTEELVGDLVLDPKIVIDPKERKAE